MAIANPCIALVTERVSYLAALVASSSLGCKALDLIYIIILMDILPRVSRSLNIWVFSLHNKKEKIKEKFKLFLES